MSLKHPFRTGVLGLVAAVVATWSSAYACELTIARVDVDRSLVYEPFSGMATIADLEVEVVNTGSDPCLASVAAQSDDRGPQRRLRFGAGALRYELSLAAGQVFENDANAPIGDIRVIEGAGGGATVTLRLEIGRGQIVESGVYSDRLRLVAFAIVGGVRRIADQEDVVVAAHVEPSAQINIAGAGAARSGFSSASIDFGELEPGERRRTVLQVRSTGPVSVVLDSANSGQLRQATRPDLAGIPYEIIFDREVVDLESGWVTVNRSPTISARGSSYPLVVRIGDFGARAAGRYEDTITISVTAE